MRVKLLAVAALGGLLLSLPATPSAAHEGWHREGWHHENWRHEGWYPGAWGVGPVVIAPPAPPVWGYAPYPRPVYAPGWVYEHPHWRHDGRWGHY